MRSSAVTLSRAALRAAAPAAPSARAFSTVDWGAVMGKLTTDAAKSEISRLRGVYGEQAALAAKYSGPPAPIDFAAYKGKVDPEMLAAAEKSYAEFSASSDKPTFSVDTSELAKMVAQLDDALKGAAELVEESKVRIAELEAEVSLLTNKKTGPETSVSEIFERYPGMEDEIHQEIANFDFKKDSGM